MSNYPSYSRKTYFGVAALVTGIISVLFSGASYSIVYLNISQEQFNVLNKITALAFCSLTPITVLLGIIGLTRKKDSRAASIIAIILVFIPTVIVFSSLMSSFSR